MAFWNWLTGLLDQGGIADASSLHHTDINPATGLPMVGGIGGVDVLGSPYGTDLHHPPHHHSSHDSWSSSPSWSHHDDSTRWGSSGGSSIGGHNEW